MVSFSKLLLNSFWGGCFWILRTVFTLNGQCNVVTQNIAYNYVWYLLFIWIANCGLIKSIDDFFFGKVLCFVKKQSNFWDFFLLFFWILGMFTPRMPNWKRGRGMVRNTIYGLSNNSWQIGYGPSLHYRILYIIHITYNHA